MSRITVIGTGYVGLTSAACFADLGNEVCAIDVDAARVERLAAGDVPFFERGLQELVSLNASSGRLRFTTDYAEGIPSAEFIFITVGTPMGKDGDADLSQVRQAASAVARHLTGYAVIVSKSTVPIGTGDMVSELIRCEHRDQSAGFAVVSNPEFLREGSAVRDFMEPDRIVLGSHDHDAADRVAGLYEPLNVPVLSTDLYTAEIIKYASNAFLATKISFINLIARLCEPLQADVKVVAQALGMDHRIGPSYLEAGAGYGGSCLPKDVLALSQTLERSGAHPLFLREVMEINRTQPLLLVDKAEHALGTLTGRSAALLGLSFKPNTDDMREAPSISIALALRERGAVVRAYDPAAMALARDILPFVKMEADAYSAARNADVLIVVTEWKEFCQLDMKRIKAAMRQPVIIDGRNIYSPCDLRTMGFVYRGVGR